MIAFLHFQQFMTSSKLRRKIADILTNIDAHLAE